MLFEMLTNIHKLNLFSTLMILNILDTTLYLLVIDSTKNCFNWIDLELLNIENFCFTDAGTLILSILI